jgi:hypothetical protein
MWVRRYLVSGGTAKILSYSQIIGSHVLSHCWYDQVVSSDWRGSLQNLEWFDPKNTKWLRTLNFSGGTKIEIQRGTKWNRW